MPIQQLYKEAYGKYGMVRPTFSMLNRVHGEYLRGASKVGYANHCPAYTGWLGTISIRDAGISSSAAERIYIRGYLHPCISIMVITTIV